MSDPHDQIQPSQAPDPQPAERQLLLDRNGHRYTFRYRAGEEWQMLDALIAMAEDPASDIEWYDAAMLSHGIGAGLREMLQELVKH